MVVAAVLIAPAVLGVATRIERRLGPSAGGWVTALPSGFAVADVAVLVDSGGQAASTMALSAAAHVVACVALVVVLAAALGRQRWIAGAVGGALAYLLVSLGVAVVPEPLAVVLAVPALVVASRVMPLPPPRAAAARHWSATLLTCLACAIVVGGSVLSAQWAGPVVAGAVAAFPTTSTMLAAASSVRAGRRAPAAVSVLVGLVRSLPCYLAFCLAIALLVPALGLFAVPLALLACVGIGWMTWRTVPLAPKAVASTTLPRVLDGERSYRTAV